MAAGMTDTSTASTTARSEALLAAAQRVIPGGVSSPVRAFRGVGGTPRFIAAGQGAHVTDADGRTYVDGREIYVAKDLRVGLFGSTEGF